MRTRAHTVGWSLLVLLGMALLPLTAWGVTRHISPNGTDANSCGASESRNNPKLNFHGSSGALTCMASGDTLLLLGGVYSEHFNPATGALPNGTPGNYTTIAGYPGERPVLTRMTLGHNGGFGWILLKNIRVQAPQLGEHEGGWNALTLGFDSFHIRVEDMDLEGGHTCIHSGGSNTEIVNSRLHGAYWYGTYWSGAQSVFDNNEVYDNRAFSFHLYTAGDHFDINNVIIRNNRIYNNNKTPPDPSIAGNIVLSHGHGIQMYNNLIVDNGAGFVVDYGCEDCKVINNTLAGNAGGLGVTIAYNHGVLRAVVVNNILWNSGDIQPGGESSVITNNLIGVDPQFVSTTGPMQTRFALTEGSPARNKGLTMAAVTHDHVGTPRPQEGAYDIGALEYAPGGVVVQPPPPPAPKPRSVVTNLRLRTLP